MNSTSIKPRSGFPASRVFCGIAILTLAIFAGMGVAYLKLIRYERVAARHVPEGAIFAARVDLEKVVLYEPVRKHLLPLLNGVDAADTSSEPEPQSRSRLARIEEKTGIKLGMDIREILIAIGPSEHDWVVVMGGLFPKSGVVEGIHAALKEEGSLHGSYTSNDSSLSFQPSGVVLTQAADGALVAASSLPLLIAAVSPHQERSKALGLSSEGAGGFGLSQRFAALVLPTSTNDRLEVERAFGEAVLGSSTALHVTIDLGQATDPNRLQEHASELIDVLRKRAAALAGTDFAGERALLARAEVSVRAPNQVVISSIWERSEIDRGAKNLAAWLHRYLSAFPPTTP